MKNKDIFLEKIRELEKTARAAGGVLTEEEIRAAFADQDISREHFEYICRFFESRQIGIQGRDKPVNEDPSDHRISMKETRSGRDVVDLYMKELDLASRLSPAEEERLLAELALGSVEARNLLVEGLLPMAAEIAGAYRGKGLSHADLIQESNLCLIMATSSYDCKEHGDYRDYLREEICGHLEEQLSDYTQSMRSARKMARLMNRLNDTAAAFAAEHEREASVEELADRMGLSEEEVRELMKASLDAVNISIGQE